MTDWNKRFLDLAEHISTWSKDTIKVGCLIVNNDKRILSTGYNGMPSWFDDTKLFDLGSNKNKIITHAEINAMNCLKKPYYERSSFNEELTLYVTRPPCSDCAKFICLSYINIKNIYYFDKTNKEHQESLDIFKKYGVSATCLLKE